MKVAFNAIPLMSPLTGIGQYAKQLLMAMDDMPSLEVHKFYAREWRADIAEEGWSDGANRFRRWVRTWMPYAYDLSRAMQQHLFSTGVKAFRPDVYHEPNFLAYRFDGPSVITVHDLSWIRFPEMHPLQRVRAMNKYFEPALRRATRVITDSRFVRQELVDVFGLSPSLIHPVSLGVEPLFMPRDAQASMTVLQSHGLRHGAFWLAVGTLEPRKNLQVVLRAFMNLPRDQRRRCPLILVGMKGWKTSAIEQQLAPLVAAGEVRQLGYLSRADLAMVMASAKALIYPSVYEGFGLPPLEAMSCGVPVVASNVSSLPEVVGETGVLVDPHDVDALTQTMSSLEQDLSWRNELGARALARSAEFSWARCAQQTMDVYRAAVS
jgi:alpha-1,3-rhamnosyl/mannosyltransferase